MAHNKHIIDGINKDLQLRTKKEWLAMTEGWDDPYGKQIITEHEGVKVVRDDHMVGSKCRFADLLMQNTEEDTVPSMADAILDQLGRASIRDLF